MIIALLGASGSGKSTIESILHKDYGYEKIISFTTRPKRDYEKNGVDYHFVDLDTFKEAIDKKIFVEYDEFSQDRFYGTMGMQYLGDTNKVIVMTPHGLRQIQKNLKNVDVVTVFVDSNLGTRVKRYINRCGIENFNFDDKNEICMRVERDFIQFKGIENEVDLTVHNNEGTNINDLVQEILQYVEKNC